MEQVPIPGVQSCIPSPYTYLPVVHIVWQADIGIWNLQRIFKRHKREYLCNLDKYQPLDWIHWYIGHKSVAFRWSLTTQNNPQPTDSLLHTCMCSLLYRRDCSAGMNYICTHNKAMHLRVCHFTLNHNYLWTDITWEEQEGGVPVCGWSWIWLNQPALYSWTQEETLQPPLLHKLSQWYCLGPNSTLVNFHKTIKYELFPWVCNYTVRWKG